MATRSIPRKEGTKTEWEEGQLSEGVCGLQVADSRMEPRPVGSHTEARDGVWPLQVGIPVVQAPLVTPALPVLSPEPGQQEEKVEDAARQAQVPRACYQVSGTEEPGSGWRLVALHLGPRLLLLLLSAQSPTHGLRGLATHTLHALTPLL